MPASDLALPFEKHVLPNGLEVILHRDHANPVVAVYVYYHVGSSREEPGKSGFAHLFEHMLFQGSEHVGDNDHFKLIQEAGGTLNGTTNHDRTNYFEVLPANQLELALWLESDRMGFLLPAMTQEKLDNQRDVVMNERRQSYENRPYGLVYETLVEALYPKGHPYSWPTIGSMDDIAAATLDDVSKFFRRWYGPNNATLAIGGDFDPAEALALAEKYFGSIPRGPAVEKPSPDRSGLAETRRPVLEDSVQLPQLSLCWPTVEDGDPHAEALDLLADVLSANRSSILDHALMTEEELASYVTIAHQASERDGLFLINLRPNPGVTLDTLERRVDQLIADYVANGVTEERVERLKTRRIGMLVRSLETVSNRTRQLAIDNCFWKDPGRFAQRLERLRAVTELELRALAATFLEGQPRVALSVVPEGRLDLAASGRSPEAIAAEEALDRDAQPPPGAEHPFHSPEIWHATLANGLPATGTPFAGIPLTHLSLAVPAGRLFETPETIGLAELTALMLEEGTHDLDGNEFVDTLDGLGAEFSVDAQDDEIVLRLSVLDEHLEEAVRLLTDVVLRPRFEATEFERVRRQQLVDVETLVDRPRLVAIQAFRRLVHGPGVAGSPRSGTRASLEALTLADVERFWRAGAHPAAARLSIVGDVGPDDVRKVFAALDSDWGVAAGAARDPQATPETLPETTRIYLVDKPGAQQSELRIGHGGIARTDPDWFAAAAMNHGVGGSFTSRLNLNLREEKGYTYGIRSSFTGGRTPGSFLVSTAVQTEVTAAAVAEILKELAGVVAGIRDGEVEFARRSMSLSLSRSLESGGARLTLVETIGKYGWPDDYPARRLAWLGEMDRAELDRLAQRLLHPESLFVVVVGDRARVEEELAGLGRGVVALLGADGQPA